MATGPLLLWFMFLSGKMYDCPFFQWLTLKCLFLNVDSTVDYDIEIPERIVQTSTQLYLEPEVCSPLIKRDNLGFVTVVTCKKVKLKSLQVFECFPRDIVKSQ